MLKIPAWTLCGPPLLLLPQCLHVPVTPQTLFFSLTKLNFVVHLLTRIFCIQTTQCCLPAYLACKSTSRPPCLAPCLTLQLRGGCWTPRRQTRSQKHLSRDVLRVITHAWPLNGHVCYLHNNASRAAKSFIAHLALTVAPCQTHTHTLPTVESTGHPPADGSKEDAGRHKLPWKTRHLHQTLKVGLFGAHLCALALGGGGGQWVFHALINVHVMKH